MILFPTSPSLMMQKTANRHKERRVDRGYGEENSNAYVRQL